ncbi:MAG: sigma-70 family RNA polymerase sigma factor [Calditrichaeota bacterium]|nr:sigma-70 family RNA polymerase sigma factor [Calditrichota bacterium]MCB0267692.1 sigma-70 family RNA polymerase sigma factor [Calditrichota bacterium]MCB0288146.1 sigma-70 family RNA polymerase sigma factor [Calditrichota bacterium]MCB0299098.1 sigma-70 family RNA polymerase sigma factor [Calditrichota bacterium]MCB9067771.1 sigma-70 family RNA polymerase sigma factor [Calditrichia bacterium]
MDKARTKQLVKRAKSGDDDAFTELIELYSERIYNLGLRILRRPDDAADVLQETFIKVYEKIDTFDGRADFFTWLYRIATNEALMRIRKEKRTVLSDTELEKYYDRPNSAEIQEWQDVPLRDMLSREFKKHLDKAVEALPEIYRSVFVLRDLESISTRETSKILGITETNVKVRLKRARMYLREQLVDYMNEFQGISS